MFEFNRTSVKHMEDQSPKLPKGIPLVQCSGECSSRVS